MLRKVGFDSTLTRLRSAIIDWLSNPPVGLKPPVLSYYVDAARPDPATTLDILHALVKQIAVHYRDSNTPMTQKLHEEMKAICTSLAPASTIFFNLTAVIQHFLRVQPLCFLVVDGLDSLLESEIQMFMKFLRHIWDTTTCLDSHGKLILSCRETLGRRIRLDNIPCSAVLQLRLEHLQSDIHLYVDSEVDTRHAESPITADDALVDEIKSVLKSNSEKM